MKQTLLVIVPDRLSEIVAKGEFTPRYYNPGGIFTRVHLLVTNDAAVDLSEIRPFVGDAALSIDYLPTGPGFFVRTLGWRPALLGGWAAPAVRLAEQIRPALIRCHGAHLNLFVAWRIYRELGIPYVVSLHINPDEDIRGRATTWRERIATQAIQSVERLGLREAAKVLPVYRPIVPYLERLGVKRFEVVHNALGVQLGQQKSDYTLRKPVRLLCVGRQLAEKNPCNIVRALRDFPEVHLTIVGDGPLHNELRALARNEGVDARVRFVRAISNEELCRTLRDYDIFVVHSEYWEISKAVLEALLVGLPVVINRRHGEPVPELTPDIAEFVENSPHGYRAAIRRLLDDDIRRERMGRAAGDRAWASWAPERMESRVGEIYREVMEK